MNIADAQCKACGHSWNWLTATPLRCPGCGADQQVLDAQKQVGNALPQQVFIGKVEWALQSNDCEIQKGVEKCHSQTTGA